MSSRLVATLLVTGFFLTTALTPASADDSPDNPARVLILVIDGLRPDYVTPELAPRLHALAEQGVYGERHSAVYPTYTRANSPSVATGSYPRTHGLLHNHLYHPAIGEAFSTGNADNLIRLKQALDGELLTTPSLAEILDDRGYQMLAVGTGGTGNTLLQNYRGKGLGIWQVRGLFLPEEAAEEAARTVGEPPGTRGPEGTVWAVDAYLHHALGDNPPDATIMWLGEPDAAGHSHGVGAPETLQAVTHVDQHIGRLLDAHDEHDIPLNVFVTADHGFSTTTGGFHVGRTLDDADLDDDRLRVVRNMVYIQDDDPDLIAAVAEALQRNPHVGNVYTRPAHPHAAEGIAPGTLSTAAIQWQHPRSPAVIASPAWTDDVNEYGYAGTTTFGGTATHGSDSPFDLHIPLIAAGPDVKTNLTTNAPTGNADFAPTALHLLGIDPPDAWDGRVLHELLRGGPDPDQLTVREARLHQSVTYPDGFRYESEMKTLRVGDTVYLRGARTHRDN